MKHILSAVLITASQLVFAQSASMKSEHYNLSGNLAMKGYDPVSYFTTGKPAKGSASIKATHDGILYYFSTEQNKDTFLKNPSAYEAQYGGWCAFAMGDYAKKVDVDPETFKIVNGKLYLFYNSYLNNTLKSWNKDEKNLMQKADANWAKATKN